MNSTKLGTFCDKVLEIGWLLAVIITPLLFNVYSSRVFEPDKLTTLRTVALIMSAIWMVKYIEERAAGRQGVGFTWRTPLVLPTLFTVVVYLLSTLLSVTPHVSFIGSYQRLQGTYTTLAYIVVFLIILQGLRTRAQLNRLITVMIINSLPVALYGLIQRNKLDPLPWGGDVTNRIASNMGNAIFVAAYLIMTFPLTVGRIAESFKAILTEEDANWADIPRAAGYIFIAAVQLIAIWYSKSRGPMVGLMASLGVWAIVGMLSLQRVLHRRAWRALWIGMLTIVILAAIGFLLINLNGPIHEWALDSPLSRVARILQYQGGTGMVRNLIWEGALDLIKPHPPIQFPPTQEHPAGYPDPFNALRPLVGYGPESMYVAYNGFYPPLLGHYESRTASPDRSHNETMDSLVITGLLGFGAYVWLFGSVFYFALQWMGFIPNDWRRWLFIALLAGGAIVATAIVVPLIAPHFFCLAIPIGMVGGMLLYLIVYGFSEWKTEHRTSDLHPHFILLTSILATVVAHFVEINFGIAIAATRTTFWACIGILVVVGLNLISESDAETTEQAAKNNDQQGKRRQRRRKNRKTSRSPAMSTLLAWLWPVLTMSIIGGFILGTLTFDFITNAERIAQPMSIVWRALTVLPAQDSRTSYGALMIFALTWLMSAIIFLSEMAKDGAFSKRKGDGTLATVLYLLISLIVGFGFGLTLADRQAAMLNVQAQTMDDVLALSDHVASFLTAYYVFIFFALIAGGLTLFLKSRRPTRESTQPWGAIALVVLIILALAASTMTNLRPIQADTVYKQASPYDRGKQWMVAIEHYKHAIELAFDEDFYYLYLGRAYLEYASSIDDPAVRETVLRETEQTLLEARTINPLNTDHSANLARMYRRWMDFADADNRQSLFQKSAENYDIATTLSPQNAILWNEWALLYLSGGDFAQAQEKCSHSLELDPDFDDTWWKVQASIYASQNNITKTIEAYEQALEINPGLADVWLLMGDTYMRQKRLEEAIEAYEQALELKPKHTRAWRMLGSLYAQVGRLDEAIAALEHTLELKPEASDAWDTHRMLAIVYNQLGQNDAALSQAQTALELAPEDQQANMESLVAQLMPASGE